MNTINGSGMHVPIRELAVGGAQPKQMAGLNGFGDFVQEANSPPITGDGCSGAVNQVDLEAFFAAWGTDNAMYDIDNSGVVDGADLAMFLTAPSSSAPGSVEDINAQWGVQGESTADLNADGIVDGQDLAIALGNAGPIAGEEEPTLFEGTKLELLLADWGTDAKRSDYNKDGVVNGMDLSLLLGGLISPSPEGNYPIRVKQEPPANAKMEHNKFSSQNHNELKNAMASKQVFNRIDKMEHNKFSPQNHNELKNAMASKQVFNRLDKMEHNKFPPQNLNELKIAKVSKQVFNRLDKMGHNKFPPQNLNDLIDAFQLNPAMSKAMISKIIDLFGGRTGGIALRG